VASSVSKSAMSANSWLIRPQPCPISDTARRGTRPQHRAPKGHGRGARWPGPPGLAFALQVFADRRAIRLRLRPVLVIVPADRVPRVLRRQAPLDHRPSPW
jgi:hypothetical protein